MTIKVEDNKIIFSRTIEAPIEKVFDAYTTKALFEKWFHPKDASTKVFRFNAVSGGDAFYAIKTPTMTSYTLAEYKTVKRPYIDSFATPQGAKDTKMPSMKITLSFSKSNTTKTTVTSTSVFPTKEAAQQVVNMGVEQGMNQTLDQLDALLK